MVGLFSYKFAQCMFRAKEKMYLNFLFHCQETGVVNGEEQMGIETKAEVQQVLYTVHTIWRAMLAI